MVGVSQGEIWWADRPAPAGSAPGLRRPVVIVQGNHVNRSRIATSVSLAEPPVTGPKFAKVLKTEEKGSDLAEPIRVARVEFGLRVGIGLPIRGTESVTLLNAADFFGGFEKGHRRPVSFRIL